MGAIHRFRVHGINTVVENPNRLTEERRQTNFGYPRWRQQEGTGNWFHLAIPTPQKINGDTIDQLFQIQLHVHRDEGVEIQKIHVRTGHHLAKSIDNPSIRPNEPHWYEAGNHRNELGLPVAALCLSIYVFWHNSDSYIRFYEAAAAWED